MELISEVINGERAQALCDVLLVTHEKLLYQTTLHKPPLCDIPRVLMSDPVHILAGKLGSVLDRVPFWRPPVIFVFSDYIEPFFQTIVDHIKRPFILVTHNSDDGVDDRYIKHLDNNLLVLWLAQNCYIRHKKLVHLPIGMANTMWPHGDLSVLARVMPKNEEEVYRPHDVLACFNLNTNPTKRSLAKYQLQRVGIENESCHLSFESYMNKMKKYKYSVCPQGNGVDTHRFWECIYMKVIPIVEDHVMIDGFGKDLHCVRVSSFSEIDKDKILARYKTPTILPRAAFLSTYKSMVHNHVVLVHVGDHMCDYLQDCIAQIRLWNKHSSIHLGINSSNMNAYSIILAKHNVHLINLEDIPMSQSHIDFLQKSTHDTTSRNGFWRHASERIFYVHDIIAHHGLENVLHFENDQLIFFDIAHMMPAFALNYRIGIPFDSPKRAIPSIVFFKNNTACSELTSFMAKMAHRGIDDMHIMREFQKHSFDIIKGLPIVAPENAMVASGRVSSEYAKHYEEFESIFDAACLGQYIGGVDPRNIPGDTRGFVNDDTPLRADLMELHWRRDVPTGLWEPFAANVKVNNLHMHCKDLKRYMSDNHGWMRACNKKP